MDSSDLRDERFSRFVARHIRRSRRRITIMFTDVVGSTQYWESRGDLQGRLMIDLHNRLISPLIKRHGGKVIKHVGDSVMASFRSPKKALSAAISIQQKLEEYRKELEDELPSIRIGLHTGKALVEDNDVFGRTVNIASRINDYADGDGISLSHDTVRRLNRRAFRLHKEGRFVLKGMRKGILLYRCDWREHPSLIEAVKEDTSVGLGRKQRTSMLMGVILILLTFGFFCFRYLRFPIVLEPQLAALNLKLPPLFIGAPAVLAGLIAVGWLLLYWTPLVSGFYRMIRGLAGFSAAFLACYLVSGLLPQEISDRWQRELYGGEHSFVEALADDLPIYPQADTQTEPLAVLPWRQVLPIEDAKERNGRVWLQVHCGPDCLGWVARTVPAGEEEVVQSRVIWLTLYYVDFYSLIAGLVGFIWGYISFRIRPA